MEFAGTPTVEMTVPAGEGGGARLPWWAKIAAKIILTRAIPSYAWRKRLGIGVHSFATDTLGHPLEIAREIAWFESFSGRTPKSLLELGPGDSLANALYAASAGVGRIWLMDAGDFATTDMDAYRRIAATLPGLPGLDFASRKALLASLNATYLTGGVASLAAIPDGAVDLTVSYVVLEHIRRAAFTPLMAELHRITASGGLGHHFIDLMDHLGGGLNNLRFGTRLWEHDAISSSGFYTNRLGYAAILAEAVRAGFATSVPYLSRWQRLPIPRDALAADFALLPDETLTIANFALQLRRT